MALSSGALGPQLMHDHRERVTFPALLSFTPLTGSPAQFAAAHRTIVAGVKTPVCCLSEWIWPFSFCLTSSSPLTCIC